MRKKICRLLSYARSKSKMFASKPKHDYKAPQP